MTRRRILCYVTLLLCLPAMSRGQDPETTRRIKQSVGRGLGYLRKAAFEAQGGTRSIVALAMLKGGAKLDEPIVRGGRAMVIGKTEEGTYRPYLKRDHIYEAGADLMLMAELPADQEVLDAMRVIATYLIDHQTPEFEGAWDYLPPKGHGGDTSASQYALLGLWSAARAGIEVPLSTWDRAAQWFMRFQESDGGFTYHPNGGHDLPASHSLTAAGAGSLGICRHHLYPGGKSALESQAKKKKKNNSPLEVIDLNSQETQTVEQTAAPQGIRTGLAQINERTARGVAWINNRYTTEVSKLNRFPLYYIYGLERLCAFENIEKIGSHSWYLDGVTHLLEVQKDEGYWKGQATPEVSTAFAILFLMRSTGKALGRDVGPPIGGGLLAGGRGFGSEGASLKGTQIVNGKVKQRKVVGPVDELLATLENAANQELPAVQQAIVESVQLGDREKLIGQKDRLVKLLDHRQPDIRRTAAWALGRCEDLSLAKKLVDMLEEDPDLDVVIEVRGALCALSRRPRGFGLPPTPYPAIPAGATDAERLSAVRKWRSQVVGAWHAWYRRSRPYAERDDILDLIGTGSE